MPIIEEELQVGKRVVETGGARIRSRIIERPVEESVRLRVEHVRVERNPVNRPATEADLANFREGEIELREQAEVPVVGKEARVVEEVRLGKDVEERQETIHETVRRTDVEVENLSGDVDSTTTHTNRTTNNLDMDRNPNL
uniref:YsnF/AvaK domain-containing protein n=1 Tax=Adhaeribacter swui TaxID=2086471 RepID=UPI0037432ACC